MAGTGYPFLLEMETAVFVFGALLLSLDMVLRGSRPGLMKKIAHVGMAALLAYSFLPRGAGIGWHGMVVADSTSLFFERFFLTAGLLVFIMMGRSRELEGRDPAEYYALSTFAMLGMMFMARAHNLMTLFMALELLTISFYVLVAYSRDENLGLEAGIEIPGDRNGQRGIHSPRHRLHLRSDRLAGLQPPRRNRRHRRQS